MVKSILVVVILLTLTLWALRLWVGAIRHGGLREALNLMGESLAQIFGGLRPGT